MTDVKTSQSRDIYLERFARFEKPAPADPRAWLLPVRKAAMATFAANGFPTTKDEDWRYTNVAPIAAGKFIETDGCAAVTPRDLEPFTAWDADAVRLVFIDGRFSPKLSRLESVPEGVQILPLAEALERDDESVRAHLTRYARYQDETFIALNTAFIEDGALVRIRRGQVIRQPIHLVFLTGAANADVVSFPRVLIVAEPNSQAVAVESHVALRKGGAFTNAVTEVVVAEQALLDHYKIVRLTPRCFHVGTLQIQLGRNSNLHSHTLSLDGRLVRNNLNAILDGDGSDAAMHGLYVLFGEQHVDNHLRVEHVKPHCNSREFFKGVLDGKSRGVFSGRIFVHKGAQKTDAKQTNMNLLLSPDALVDTKPQLEIFADDVKCTHGATIGQIDDDAIFYLRSRGIGAETARGLLVFGFAAESIEEVRIEPLRKHLLALVAEGLPHGDLLRDLA
jgi:Fe-S cluster assembly protein SufD